MDIRNSQPGEQIAKSPRNGRGASRRSPVLEVIDPQPVTALRAAWRSTAQMATIGIFVILLFVALSLARAIVLPVVAAFVVAMLLAPLSQRADAMRIPSILSAVALWFLAVGSTVTVVQRILHVRKQAVAAGLTAPPPPPSAPPAAPGDRSAEAAQ